MNYLKYLTPICKLDFAKSLWWDTTSKDEIFYHLFTVQIRRKIGVNAILFVFLGFSFIFTSPFVSDIIERFINKDNE